MRIRENGMLHEEKSPKWSACTYHKSHKRLWYHTHLRTERKTQCTQTVRPSRPIRYEKFCGGRRNRQGSTEHGKVRRDVKGPAAHLRSPGANGRQARQAEEGFVITVPASRRSAAKAHGPGCFRRWTGTESASSLKQAEEEQFHAQCSC